jgi:hypothetical protein
MGLLVHHEITANVRCGQQPWLRWATAHGHPWTSARASVIGGCTPPCPTLNCFCAIPTSASQRLLPAGVDAPASFETIGHVAHLNLRAEQLLWRYVIGQVRPGLTHDKCFRPMLADCSSKDARGSDGEATRSHGG